MGKSRLQLTSDEPVQYPSWFYGPDGQSAIFDSEDEVPDDWSDHPSTFAKEGRRARPEQGADGSGPTNGRQPETVVDDDGFYNAMSMDELRKHLDAKNISYHPKASREKLTSLLRTARPEAGHPSA